MTGSNALGKAGACLAALVRFKVDCVRYDPLIMPASVAKAVCFHHAKGASENGTSKPGRSQYRGTSSIDELLRAGAERGDNLPFRA